MRDIPGYGIVPHSGIVGVYEPTQEPNPSVSDQNEEADALGSTRNPKPEGEQIRMKHIKIIGLALVAVFAISVAASATASAALPELLKSGGGELVNKTITTKSKTGESPKLEAKSGNTVICTSDTSTGKAEGTKKVKEVVVTFKGCEATILGSKEKCNSTGKAAGEIETEQLSGEIGYISASAKTVGLALWPSSRTAAEKEAPRKFEKSFVAFKCGIFANNSVKGAVVGQLTVTNGTTKGELAYNKKGAETGVQELQKLEGVEGGEKMVLMSSLNGGAFEESNEQTHQEVTFGENAELKA
jgi:hypothetical protein